MAEVVYLLCFVTSIACALLLVRGYLRHRTPLLLWSSVSFSGLALNNAMLVVDLILIPDTSLAVVRSLVALVAVAVLLFGLIWNTR